MAARPGRFHRALLLSCKFLLVTNLVLISDSGHAQSYTDASSQFTIKATPTEIDEGEVVSFELINLSYRDKTSGRLWEAAAHPSKVNWQFAAGIPATGALGLYKISHRFLNDSETPSKVGVRHQNTDKITTIQVKNVKPKIYRMWHSTPVFKDLPVKFHALAKDPGILDELTYSWDFGDGNTATGQDVEHTFSGTGDYQITLKVSDEISFDIRAIDVDIESDNSFKVSGDVSLPRVDIDYVILAGSTSNPMAKNTGEACQIRLQMGNEALETSFTLTANLKPGFSVRNYSIGKTTEWDGSHQDDVGSQGTFFADLSLPSSIAIRDFGGRKVGGPFWSENGTVTIQKFNTDELGLSFQATLLENIPGEYYPRRTQVTGNLSTHVERSVDGVFKGLGTVFSAMGNAMSDPEGSSDFEGANFYLCDKEEPGTFDIETWTPAANETSTQFKEPEISVTFTQPVDPESLPDNAHLEYRVNSGFGTIPGGWEVLPDDPRTIRFVPQAFLLPAVVYCMRIDANTDGLKSVTGDTLAGSNAHGFSPAMRPACEYSASTQFGANTRRSAFATQVELASVRVDLYQNSLVGVDTLLVPHKPTLARVYPYWQEYNAVHPTAMVKKFEAMVEVGSDTGLFYPPQKAKIRRPDQYTELQTRKARNSINFFGWRPGESSTQTELFAEIVQLNQAGELVEEVTRGETTVVETWPHEADFKQLTIQPYFIPYQGDCSGLSVQGCDWRNGLSAFWRNMAQRKLAGALAFTTQNFPFVSTVTKEDQTQIPSIQFTAPGATGVCASDADFYCYQAGTEDELLNTDYIADLIFDAAKNSDADILLGIAPPGFFVPGNIIGLQSEDSLGRPLVFAQIDDANAATITHEFGHFFGLDHCPPGEDDSPCDLTPIQAFRMAASAKSRFNKHHDEGNQQALALHPLMYPTEWPVNSQFITVSQYRKLFGEIHQFRKPTAFIPMPADPTPEPSWLEILFLPAAAYAQDHSKGEQQQLIVSGTARNGQVHINRIRVLPTQQIADIPAMKGPYTLELTSGDNSMVQYYAFDLNRPSSWHGQEMPTTSFRVSVPAPADLHSIHITGPGGASAGAQASPNKPAVTARITNNAGNGLKTLQWSATDADGDALRAMVYLKGDDGDWYGVAADFAGSQIELPPSSLPAAKSVLARVIISDGFNSASTELDIGAGAPLSVLVANPENGAQDVDVMPEISAWISNPLLVKDSGSGPVGLPSGKFTLSDAAGKIVPATVSYLGPERILTLTPDQPLAPASRYQANLAGLKDRWNNPLAKPYSWSFETEPEEVDPEARPELEDFPPDDDPGAAASKVSDDASTKKVGTTPTAPLARAESSQGAPDGGSANSSGDCSCACDQRAFADELCELFCEEEFATCKGP